MKLYARRRIILMILLLLVSANLYSQTTTYTEGEFRVDVSVINPCEGNNNGSIVFKVVSTADNQPAFLTVILGPVNYLFDPVSIPVGGTYTHNPSKTLPQPGAFPVNGVYGFVLHSNNENDLIVTLQPSPLLPVSLYSLPAITITDDVSTDLTNSDSAIPNGQISVSLAGGSRQLEAAPVSGNGSFTYTWSSTNGLAGLPLTGTYNGTGSLDLATLLGRPGLPGGDYTLEIDDNYSDCGGTSNWTITDICAETTLEQEYHALMAFYAATNGDDWINNTGWVDADPDTVQSVAGWYGLTVDVDGHVTDISIPENHLDGELPYEIGNFSKLKTLHIYRNSLLHGSIPASIGNLCSLEGINFYDNELTGSIPSSIGNLTKLKGIDFSFNQLTDSIPSSIGGLTDLRTIEMDNNQLSGQIPSSLGGLPLLLWFSVTINHLSGTIPTTFGNLTSLQHLNLAQNELTGSIPPGLGSLSALSYVNVQVNRLSGDLPDGFGSNALLDLLIFNANRFTFSSFLSVKEDYAGTTFVYANQDSVDVKKTIQAVTGEPVILTTNIDRSTSPASKYQWFRYVNGISDVELIPDPTTDGHTYTIANPTLGDNGTKYYYKIYNDSATLLELVSRLQTLQVQPCAIGASVDFTTEQFLCATKFTPVLEVDDRCRTSFYLWSFGDGGTSTAREPLHLYAGAGTYTVSLQCTFNCGSCEKDTTVTREFIYDPGTAHVRDSLFTIITDIKEQVITASVATFSDSWPLQYPKGLDTLNSFLNGTAGVWRSDASYVYDVPRQSSPVTNVSKDGTFSMDQFAWRSASLNAVPHWTKANSMTQYSPFSYELENRDVLGVYSSALYDYGGHLPSANGVNMRNEEMAFTSFEFSERNVTGNWIFGTEPVPVQTIYVIQSANKYEAIVEASLQELAGLDTVEVVSNVFALPNVLPVVITGTRKLKKKVVILCMQAHPDNPSWTVIVMDRDNFAFPWSGELIVKNEVTPNVSADIDSTLAHAGKRSLRISTEKTFRQDLLRLDSTKSYWFSGWVSVNNPSVAVPVLAEDLGVDIIIKDTHDQVVATVSMVPSGRIIEGWQQVKGAFTCPINKAAVEIRFKPGSIGTAWYDDIRLHPEKGNMKSYVYNLSDYRLRAILDEENFASFFYYDKEGNLYLTKRETEAGIKTVTENITYMKESPPGN